ncbi:MAG: hypothetical protein E7621_06240 [Ruminococcaceae bacterium]|nr:hypothetical protein [Oscillospiraceae bacterium]
MIKESLQNVKNTAKRTISKLKKLYITRLVLRCFVFAFFLFLYIKNPEQFDVLNGMNFFKEFSFLHILWIVWIIDMIVQIVPSKASVSIGSLKLFKKHFKKSSVPYEKAAMRLYFKNANVSAAIIFAIWVVLISVIGVLHSKNIVNEAEMFMISALFYIFDLVCVVIWCPFRLIMRTRCCTTCRIFNWDHLMMYTPMLFIKGFYSASLIVVATIVFIEWELSLLLHPERFWEKTNCSLKCSECKDKLCPTITLAKIKKQMKKKK